MFASATLANLAGLIVQGGSMNARSDVPSPTLERKCVVKHLGPWAQRGESTHGAVSVVAWLLAVQITVTGCGASSPTSPGPVAAPVLTVASQAVEVGGSEFQLAWSGSGTTYEVSIGTSPGSSDVLTTDVAGVSTRWRAPRGGTYYARVKTKDGAGSASPEITLVSVDLRDVIDALWFDSGTLSDSPTRPSFPSAPFAAWSDGLVVRIVMSTETADTTRLGAQRFLDQYGSATDNAVTGTQVVTEDAMHELAFNQVPLNTVAVRVLRGWCASFFLPVNTLGCAQGGAANGRGMVNLEF